MNRILLFALLIAPFFSKSQIITTIAGNGINGFSGDGGPATAASFGAMGAIARDKHGNLYVVDNDRVRKISRNGIVTTVAGGGTLIFGDGSHADSVIFTLLTGIAADSSDNIYIGDAAHNRVRKVNAAGIISTFAGNGSGAYSGDTGPATSVGFYEPSGLAVDAMGNVYISDPIESIVYRVDASGAIHREAGMPTTWAYTGDGGPAVSAGLDHPFGIAVDDSGNVYIGDSENQVVRVVKTSGIISTFAGNGTMGYTGDGGAATAAQMHYPSNVATDHYGNVYIDDTDPAAVRKVDGAGSISRIAGTGIPGFSGDGGPALLAQFIEPMGLVVDAACNIYITDQFRVRKITGIRAGSQTVCVGQTLPYYTAVTATGVWGSTNPAIATISSTGIATGVATGLTQVYLAVGTDTAFSPLTVMPLPHAATVTGADTVCNGSAQALTDSTAGGIWLSGAPAFASVSIDGIITGLGIGTAPIWYVVTNSCGADTAVHIMQVVHCSDAGVAATHAFDAAKVWPNPARKLLNIEVGNMVSGMQRGTVVITNMMGVEVYRREMQQPNSLDVDISDFARGVYFVNVYGVVTKLIVE